MEDIIVCIYANGQIIESVQGTTFQCPMPRMIIVDSKISLWELKEAIREKLQLLPNQIISELIYRYPVSLNPPWYQQIFLEDNADVQRMWKSYSRFASQLSGVELYANILTVEQVSHPSSSNIHISQDNLLPSSSQPILPCTHPLLPLIQDEDIMDDFEDEDEYDPAIDPDYDKYDNDDDASSDDDDVSDDEDDEGDDGEELPTNAMLVAPIAEYVDPAVSFFSQVNTSAAREIDDPGPAGQINISSDQDLYIGRRFHSKEDFRRAVKLYSVRVHHDYRSYHSCKKSEEYRCGLYQKGCPWRVRCAKKTKGGEHWMITRYGGPHKCMSGTLTQDHRKLDCNLIASSIVEMVCETPNVSIKQVIDAVKKEFGYKVSYRKAWKAKHRAIAIGFGTWESSYAMLPRFMAAVQQIMPGSYIEFCTNDCQQSSSVGEPTVMFHRVFWAFKPCIDALAHLKPIIQIDGTFLYGKFKGTLLTATSQDGDRNVVPIAFAVVEGETESAWSWFLLNLRKHVVKERQGVCLISDRHTSIIAAVADQRNGWQPPYGYHVFCLRHVASNFHKRFRNSSLKETLKSIGYAYERRIVDTQLAELATINDTAANWIANIPKEQWTRAYDVEGHRYGHMTTNLAEAVNGVFKDVRSLPITALVRATMYRVTKYFVDRSAEINAQIQAGQIFCPTLMKKIQINVGCASACNVRAFDRFTATFEVEEPYDARQHQSGRCCKVNLSEHTCDCCEFQLEKVPCRHAIAACLSVSFDASRLVDRVFRLDTMQAAYRTKFNPVGGPDNWPQMGGPKLVPDPSMIRKRGRPRSTRIRNEMDWRSSSQPYKCGLCKQPGHNRNTCPHRSHDT